jgi:hypothetical protein
MAVKSETRHSAVLEGEERAATPNGIDGGAVVAATGWPLPTLPMQATGSFTC